MDLIGAEIFAQGKWNNLDFAEADLDEIAANFEELSAVHKVPLKLGHNDEQKMTDGHPALGWVKRVYREGTKLLADFVDMPNVVYEAIKKRLYRTVSIELLRGVEYKGKKYNNILDAVALLGADHPAVNTLEDLNKLLNTRAQFSGGRMVKFETIAGNRTQSQEMDMDPKDLKQAIADALAPFKKQIDDQADEIKKLTTENETLKKKSDDFSRKENEEKVTAARKSITEVLDSAVKDKKVTPAQREIYERQMGLADDKKVLDIKLDDVKQFCGTFEKKEEKETGMNKDKETLDKASDELVRLTRKNMADTGEKNFRVAFERIALANPKLHVEYLNSNGVAGE